MEKSSPSVDHSAVVQHTDINGAILMRIPTVHYEYGSLSEIFHPDWDTIYTEPIEHMYTITNSKHHRDQWHVHHKTIDRYLLLRGKVEIALYDNRPQESSHGTLVRLFLTEVGTDGWHGLRIPFGVWHSFRSLSDGFTLLNNKYPRYERHDPDKYVIPFAESDICFCW